MQRELLHFSYYIMNYISNIVPFYYVFKHYLLEYIYTFHFKLSNTIKLCEIFVYCILQGPVLSEDLIWNFAEFTLFLYNHCILLPYY